MKNSIWKSFDRFHARRAIVLLACAGFASSVASGAQSAVADIPGSVQVVLPSPMLAALAHARVPLSSVSVVVERMGQPTPLVALNADNAMMPASTMKLVTTWAGLSMLGPDYRWHTRAYADGDVDANGVLHGNLYIQGSGDPKLVPEELVDLVQKIHRFGITGVDGALILDKRYFDQSTRDKQSSGDDVGSPYEVAPDPLLYSFKALSFTLTPTAGSAPAVNVVPALVHLQIDNALHVTSGPCNGTIPRPAVELASDGTVVAMFRGSYARRCGTRTVNEAVLDPSTFFGEGFLALWQQTGGTFMESSTGSVVREGGVPAGARLVATHDSPPLSNIVRDINKFSNNVMARNLFLTIGAVSDRPPATQRRSAQAIAAFLRHIGLEMPELALDNGSGLSRKEHISALSLAGLLQAAKTSSVASTFVDSLPVVGVDGTMRHRLRDTPVKGNAHIKTGTLWDVRAIAGYVTAADGDNYIVVGLINDSHAAAAGVVLDALLAWVYEGLAPGISGPTAGNG